MKTIQFPDGRVALVRTLALHRRRAGRVASRPTDWLAQAGDHLAWGRTRREAVDDLLRIVGTATVRKFPGRAGAPLSLVTS